MNQQLCKFSESKNYSLYKKNLVRNKFFIKKKKLETNLIDKNSIRSRKGKKTNSMEKNQF